ncbi:MAG: hypothetical protein NVSMB20_00350 [Bradyrhizobium sp.]
MKAIGVWPPMVDCRRRRAGEGHVDQVELVGQTKQFAAEVRRRTHAGAGIAVRAGMIPDQLHQLRQRPGRHRRVDHHDVGRNRNQRHGREILDRIVRHLGVEAGIDQEARADRHDGVAVGSHARDLAGRGVAARAADILDVELLAEAVGKFLRHHARDHVGRAAGRKPDDHAHRAVRISLGP